MQSAFAAALFLVPLAFGGGASAQTTDLLLVLAADVSRSIDESEFALQRKGYSAALTDPRVLAAIRGGTTGTIAICFVEWSGAGEQNVVADWTVAVFFRRVGATRYVREGEAKLAASA